MWVRNLDETVPLLRERLEDYLQLHGIDTDRPFSCLVHKDHSPSMALNPKTGRQTAHCFSCNTNLDIFAAAAALESLPSHGSEWVTETIPSLCRQLEIPIMTGEPTLLDAERAKQLRLAQDIADILVAAGDNSGYADKRNWHQDSVDFGCIEESKLINKLIEQGHSAEDVNRSLLVRTTNQSYFGKDKLTFVIKDDRGRPIGFLYRNLTDKGPKYANTPESTIYQKSKTLLGLDTAKDARQAGLYIVEGPGDLVQLKRLGILNAAATCGTALTVDHLLTLKSMGIRDVRLCFDWDEAGSTATNRVFFDTVKQVGGINLSVVEAPGEAKDLDELLCGETSPQRFLKLQRVSGFEWALKQLSENQTPDDVCGVMVPIIASEVSSVRRELLAKQLSKRTDISYSSIMADISSLRDHKFEQRKEELLASVKQYLNEVENDPDNIVSIISQHELRVENIEKRYNRLSIGSEYQLSRARSVAEARSQQQEGASDFKMTWFRDVANSFSGGMPWTIGCLIYIGGRPNSGKTALTIALGVDVALSDEDAIVIFHFTDDSYRQTEPRIKTSIARMVWNVRRLTAGHIERPSSLDPESKSLLDATDARFEEMLGNDRLIILDSEDGANLSTLEKHVRYYRTRYPSKKILVISDNTYNYLDFTNVEQTQRMMQISNTQKYLTVKYQCCMIATVEYRKGNINRKEITLPTDNDIADSRALQFRPNIIMHVYNDLNDRREDADIFWINEDKERCPRLLVDISKNKISNYKGKLTFDIDPKTITLSPVDLDEARDDADKIAEAIENGDLRLDGNQIIWVKTDYGDVDDE